MSDPVSSASVGRFLTLADTAQILNVSLPAALDLVRTGELPAIRIGAGGSWRVERIVLESYIEAKYEEARRLSLWEQSDFANIPELSGGRILRSQTPRSQTPRSQTPRPKPAEDGPE